MSQDDLYMRANFATLDRFGHIADRRAGRLDTEKNKLLCMKLKANVHLQKAKEVFFVTEKEHRALVVLRGGKFSEQVSETDPQKTGVLPLDARALTAEAESTAAAIRELSDKVRDVLAKEEKANVMLLRGYAGYHSFPSVAERFGLNPLAVASYPMYKGIARLLGMTVAADTATIEEEIQALSSNYSNFNFFFIHIKATDSRGEDGNFAEKVKAIEKVDSLIPEIRALNPDVLVVTGDHSTPAAMASHSWHPVPVLLWAKTCRPDGATSFGEDACLTGGLGRMPMKYLMSVALAHAEKLQKFGA
jgi:2,3-bisphosphoglycerate-independent phosphoglycerate mutase